VWSYCVGAAKRDLTPRTLDGIFLGGYGFGPTRPAAGVAARLYARALAITRNGVTLVLCVIDSQGHFLAYRNGAFGFADIRRRVGAERGVAESGIVLASTHDHSAPDDTGVWGGVPAGYLKYVSERTVAAIEAAIDSERPARLFWSRLDTAPYHLLQNVLPSAYPIDSVLRVLIARDDRGEVIATLINFSAHADVLGEANRIITPDWPGATAMALEQAAPSSVAVVTLGSVGRTEPLTAAVRARSEFVAARDYGETIAKLALRALSQEHAVEGPLGAVQTKLREAVTNRALRNLDFEATRSLWNGLFATVLPAWLRLELGFTVYGEPGVDLLLRANSPPYLQVNDQVQTVIGALRVGDLLFGAVPVESYPETGIVVAQRVRAPEHFIISLAEDQLGYDPPAYAMAKVRECSPTDEAFFTISANLGADVTRALLSQAQKLGFSVTDLSYDGLSGGPTNPGPCP
jgi:hypothetical protein